MTVRNANIVLSSVILVVSWLFMAVVMMAMVKGVHWLTSPAYSNMSVEQSVSFRPYIFGAMDCWLAYFFLGFYFLDRAEKRLKKTLKE